MERGDIYLVSLDPTSGHEQQGRRPVLIDLAMNLDEQVGHMMNELEQVQDTLAKLVALYPESLSYADLDDAD